MPRYVAFLRAINVGGHVVKMDRLRALFEALRFRDVETFIASGNVLFDTTAGDTAALEQRIERHLARELGYEVATFLRAPAELAAAATHQPFGLSDPLAAGHALWVGLLKAPPSAAAANALLALGTESDDFHLRGRELYWLRRTKVSDSKLSGARLERTLGAPVTMRNVTTVRKLADRATAS